MKRKFSLPFAIVSLGISVIGVIPAAAQGIADEVMKVDEAYRIAKLDRDISTLDRILADGFNETNQNGNSRNKAQTLDLWKSFSITSLITDSSEVRPSGTTAMVTGTQTENGFERMLFTRVYVLDGGGWHLLASMQFRNPHVEQGPFPTGSRPVASISLTGGPQPIRVGADVEKANLLTTVAPEYPALAKASGVQGTVRFEATIDKSGTVQHLILMGGHPLLVQSAMDAVRQWVYKPTLLNGKPVDVVTTIDVNFTLGQ
jgi:TonB family protein